MKAVTFDAFGGLEVLKYRDVPDPVAGPGEVVVRVQSCSVNRTLDLEVRERGAGFGVKLPHISGADPAGVISQVGPGVSDFKVGDRVVAIPFLVCGECRFCRNGEENACLSLKVIGVHRPGGYAEQVTLPAGNLLKLPESLSFQDASALALSYPVAWHLLVTRAKVKPGETVLVLAAGSGLGVAGTQIAKLNGARVIAAAGSEEKRGRARALGADEVINYREGAFSEEVKRLTNGLGADVVYENIGSTTWAESVSSLGNRGRLVTCGTHGGSQAAIDIRLLYRKHASLLFSAGASFGECREVIALAGKGTLKPVIDRTYPLAEAAVAQQHLIDRKNFGKVILIP